MKNDPVYRKEVEEKLEAFHKQQADKKAIRERQKEKRTNVVGV